MELEHKNNVIPLPKEREYTAIIGEDNEVKAYLTKPKKIDWGRIGWLYFRLR